MKDRELDELIKKSLTAEEAAYYDELEDPNILDKVGMVYKGKLAWLSVIQSIAMLFVFAFAVYAAIQFFTGDEVVIMLKWGFATTFAFFATGYIKMILIDQMAEKNILREIKRLELQLSHLGQTKESA